MLFRSDRKSTRLNSSHTIISYAVFCLKKKNKRRDSKQRDILLDAHTINQRTAVYRSVAVGRSCSHSPAGLLLVFTSSLFFFFKDPAPPRILPFSPPPPFPI